MNEQFGGHLNKADVELYVINALAMERAAAVEDHVSGCEECACALAHEAQLEMALEIVAERSRSREPREAREARDVRTIPPSAPRVVALAPRRLARARRAGIGLAGAVAAAAALILWIMPSAKLDAGDDVARFGAVSSDASGAIVSFDQNKPKAADTLDGG